MINRYGRISFPVPDSLLTPRFYIFKVIETPLSVAIGRGFDFKKEVARDTHLLFGADSTYYRIVVPSDLIWAGLRIPRIYPHISAHISARRRFRIHFCCNITVEQLLNAEKHGQELMKILQILTRLDYVTMRRKNAYLEKYFADPENPPSIEKIVDLNCKNREIHHRRMRRERNDAGNLHGVMRKLEKDGAVKLSDDAYLVYLSAEGNHFFRISINGMEHLWKNLFFHVSKRGKIRRFIHYGLPMDKAMLHVIRKGGMPGGTEKVTRSDLVDFVARALGKIDPAFAMAIIPNNSEVKA